MSSVTSVASKSVEFAKWAICLALSAALVACGSGDNDNIASAMVAPGVVAADLTSPVTLTTVGALVPAAGAAPIVLTFPSGFSGTTAAGAVITLAGATTVAFPSATTFVITNGGTTATGGVSFGLCHFTVAASNIALLPVGTVLTVDPCSMNVATAGMLANGVPTTTKLTLTFGTATSDPILVTVTLNGDGTVVVGSTPVGTVAVTAAATTTTTAAATTTTTAAATTTTTAAATTTTTAAATTTTAGGGTTTTAAATTTTAPTTTTTTTTTITTTTLALAGCQVKLGSAVGYVTGVTSSSQCVATGTGSFNVSGGGAVVTAVTSIPAGATTVAVSSLATCDPFGAPPTAGATSLTPCKN